MDYSKSEKLDEYNPTEIVRGATGTSLPEGKCHEIIH
jgi:hypothetical protein